MPKKKRDLTRVVSERPFNVTSSDEDDIAADLAKAQGDMKAFLAGARYIAAGHSGGRRRNPARDQAMAKEFLNRKGNSHKSDSAFFAEVKASRFSYDQCDEGSPDGS
jgi:hypothetical protein